jgi:valyl-tRNA synthetase
MPFITEEIWQQLPHKKNKELESIIISEYPKYVPTLVDIEAETDVQSIMQLVDSIRNIRGEMHIPPGMKSHVMLKTTAPDKLRLLKAHAEYFHSLIPISDLQIAETVNPGPHSSTAIVGDIEIHIPLPSEIMDAEKTRLRKEIPKLEKEIEFVENKLNNPQFRDKAPAQVVEKERLRSEQIKIELGKLKEKLAELN